MANVVVLNALGSAVYLKASGEGLGAGDPHIPSHVVESITGALPAGTNNLGDVDVLTLVGDNIDMDSGAGADSHAGVAVLLPGAGGHVVGGTPDSPFRTDPVASTVQPVSIVSNYISAVTASVIGVPAVRASIAGVPNVLASIPNVSSFVGSVHVGNFPTVQPIGVASWFPGASVVASVAGRPTVIGSVHISNWPTVQPVSIASNYVSNVVASTIGTLYAVVNTAAAGTGHMVVNTQATVNLAATVFAVVNTGAAGTQNAVVNTQATVNIAAGNIVASIPNVANVAIASINTFVRPYTIASQWASLARIQASVGVTAARAAPGANLHNYITGVSVVNAAASYGGLFHISDGTSTLFVAYAAPAGGGISRPFLAALKPAANATVFVGVPVYSLDLLISLDGFVGV